MSRVLVELFEGVSEPPRQLEFPALAPLSTIWPRIHKDVLMVNYGQVQQLRQLRRLLTLGKTLAAAARMTDTTEKTARKFRDDERMPSQHKQPREYRTRIAPSRTSGPRFNGSSNTSRH